jgi:hypothetical protein
MMFERISKVDISQNDRTRNGARNESQPVVIAEWALNSRESLRVELSEFRGTQLIGIRKWFAAANDAMAPDLPRLAAAVNDALSKARAEGLIPADVDGD